MNLANPKRFAKNFVQIFLISQLAMQRANGVMWRFEVARVDLENNLL